MAQEKKKVVKRASAPKVTPAAKPQLPHIDELLTMVFRTKKEGERIGLRFGMMPGTYELYPVKKE